MQHFINIFHIFYLLFKYNIEYILRSNIYFALPLFQFNSILTSLLVEPSNFDRSIADNYQTINSLFVYDVLTMHELIIKETYVLIGHLLVNIDYIIELPQMIYFADGTQQNIWIVYKLPRHTRIDRKGSLLIIDIVNMFYSLNMFYRLNISIATHRKLHTVNYGTDKFNNFIILLNAKFLMQNNGY